MKALLRAFELEILRKCQDHCKLVSKSAIVRVDVGLRIKQVPKGQTGPEMIRDMFQTVHEHFRPALRAAWTPIMVDGEDFIISFFVNEVRANAFALHARNRGLVQLHAHLIVVSALFVR